MQRHEGTQVNKQIDPWIAAGQRIMLILTGTSILLKDKINNT